MSFLRYKNLDGRPSALLLVEFPDYHLAHSLRWTALLDTGSPYIILPGRCRLNPYDERVIVEPRGCEPVCSRVLLRTRGRQERFGGVGAQRKPHFPFRANLHIRGFARLEWTTVYFDEEVQYALVGTPFLFHDGGTCFSENGYKGTLCFLNRLWQRAVVWS